MRLFALACGLFVLIGAGCLAGELTVSTDFEGSSAVVESIDQESAVIRITPAGPKDRGWACWWFFRIDGITPGQAITIELYPNRSYRVPTGEELAPIWSMPERATFSTDGKTWRHTEAGIRTGDSMRYTQMIDQEQAWFAWGPPFTPTDAETLVDSIAKQCTHAKAFELCKTRGGRPVPALRIHEGDSETTSPRHGVWINARQHAWECGSSWVCAGLAEWLVSNCERAAWLRQNAEVILVPIMDIDGTAEGIGGKHQLPRDHNQDWTQEPHWNSVRAAMAGISKMNEGGNFDVYLDLHSPGRGSRKPFYFIMSRELLSPRGNRNLSLFLEAGRTEITDPLRLDVNTHISGPDPNRNPTDITEKNSSRKWVAAHSADHVVAITLETSWNTPHSTVDGYKTVGRQQGLAIEHYLRRVHREAAQ
jgi:hypothetical protein